MLSRADRWNVTDAEHDAPMPCDALVEGPARRMTRGVDVAAPADVVWAWLGMLRRAPYSYDLVDNFGRRSPRVLDASLPPLAAGQRVFPVFDVVAVEPGREFTAVAGRDWWLGPVAMTYRVATLAGGRSRLLGRMVVPEASLWRRAINGALAAGDLVMMRRQLMNLAALAERDATP